MDVEAWHGGVVPEIKTKAHVVNERDTVCVRAQRESTAMDHPLLSLEHRAAGAGLAHHTGYVF